MKRKIISTVVVMLALFIGVAVGASTQPEPEVRTVTETVTETETVTVEQTPQSCLEAIRHARTMGDHASEFASLAAEYLPLIPEAFTAGAEMDQAAADVVLSTMEDLTAQNGELNQRVGRNVNKFNAAAEECESSQ